MPTASPTRALISLRWQKTECGRECHCPLTHRSVRLFIFIFLRLAPSSASDVGGMVLGYCWASVVDAGPASTQNRINFQTWKVTELPSIRNSCGVKGLLGDHVLLPCTYTREDSVLRGAYVTVRRCALPQIAGLKFRILGPFLLTK